jgi:hypothetical protein
LPFWNIPPVSQKDTHYLSRPTFLESTPGFIEKKITFMEIISSFWKSLQVLGVMAGSIDSHNKRITLLISLNSGVFCLCQQVSKSRPICQSLWRHFMSFLRDRGISLKKGDLWKVYDLFENRHKKQNDQGEYKREESSQKKRIFESSGHALRTGYSLTEIRMVLFIIQGLIKLPLRTFSEDLR